MLTQLYINNVAVISEATIAFEPGLNVFTGETGAGKTILIHAINAVLGERTSRELIRTGEDKAVISALFTALSASALAALAEAGYPADDDAALISREISADGKSLCKLNGRPATASILKTISSLLINVHGQHDNQQLLSPQKHLGFIDGFGETDALLAQYKEAYRVYAAVKRELENVDTDETQKARRIDLLSYQIREIEDAELQRGEEDELKAQRKLIKNALNVTQALGGSITILDGSDESASLIDLLSELSDNMAEAAKYLDDAQTVSERLIDIVYEFEGFSRDIHDMLENFDCDPTQLDAIERRLDVIYMLKKKYGTDIDAILQFHDEAAAALEEIQTSDERATRLRRQLDELLDAANSLAGQLTRARLAAADRFVAAVQRELAFLDMPSVVLSVMRNAKTISPDGADEMELFIATNVGEESKSLAKIASGGELSRIMLSIKNVLADRDDIGTLIFDEIDTGVSGRAAQKIGQKLAQVAANRQVIVVTHLPQVASYAKSHLYIAKSTRDNRTFTTITPLTREQRIHELARIGGGENISQIALQNAAEMLENAEGTRGDK